MASRLSTALEMFCTERRLRSATAASFFPVADGSTNFLGKMSRFTIHTVEENGAEGRVPAVFKKSVPTPLLTPDQARGVYTTEIKTYSQVLPLFETLMSKSNMAPLWPTCLGFSEYDALLLEDLKAGGYSIKAFPLDLDHALLTVRSLATFHAASAVLFRSGALDASVIPESLFTGRLATAMMSNCIGLIGKHAKSYWPESSHYFIRVLDKIQVRFVDELGRVFSENCARFKVLNHGDFWMMNMMFKYDDSSKKPTSFKMFDFQGVHFNSAATDLQHFLHSSVSPRLLIESGDTILDEYLTTLAESFAAFGGSGDDVLQSEELRREMEATAFLGLIVSSFFLPVTVWRGEINRRLDLEELGALMEKWIDSAEFMAEYLLSLRQFEANGTLGRFKLLD